MTPERYKRLCDLFDQAQGRTPDQRDAFLGEVGAADPTLRDDLEKLLADDERARGEQLLQGPCPVNARALLPGEQPTAVRAPPPGEPDDVLVGRRVGPYLIEACVGHGGMGSVYRALREGDYRQRVALKVIRPGLDGAELLRRFRMERQVLAELEHPHIARLLDGGTTDDGRPYFVMEYIDGQPLERHCEARRLGTRERVGLLLAVCGAVRHAHGHGVLHRDLKPDNVLVTADGTPKVTDFGLAKRLDGVPALLGQTQTGAVLGTPGYMAPEQAAGRRADVGPATDVYALGAILYELLTGRPPFRAETPLETLRQVLSEEPVPPGRLHPKLARDLETICLKCLQKEPGRRYARVEELADDLQRFLAGQPIRARPVGRAGRRRRWARRKPAVAALLVVSFVFPAAGLTGVTWQWRRAERQRDRAEQGFHDALGAVDEMLTEVGQERLKDVPEMEPVRRALLQKALAYYQKFLRERGDDATVREETARAYRRVGDIEELLGHSGEAEGAYRQALALQGRLVNESRDHPGRRQDLARIHHGLGALYWRLGRTADAEGEWQAALALRERLAAESPAGAARREELALTRNGLGLVYRDTNRKDQAEAAYTQARDIWARLVQDEPAEPGYQRRLAGCYNNLSILYAELGREDDADASAEQALEAQKKVAEGTRADAEDQELLAALYRGRGWVHFTRGRMGPSEDAYKAALPVHADLVRRHPSTPRFRHGYAWTLNNLGLLYNTMGRWPEAEARFEEAVPLVERLTRDYPEVAQYQAFYAFSHHALGWAYQNIGRLTLAEDAYQKALPARRKVAREHADVPDHQMYLAQLLHEMGMLRDRTEKPAEAVKSYGEARKIREELSQRYPMVPRYREDLGWTLNNLGIAYAQLGRRPEADEVYEKALPLWRQLKDGSPRQLRYVVGLGSLHTSRGDVLREVGDPQAALVHYGEALAILEPLRQQGPDSAEATNSLRHAYAGRASALSEKLGRHREALADWDRALAPEGGHARAPDLFRVLRARTLASLGEHARATAEVEAVSEHEPPSGNVFFEMARVCALSATAARADARLSPADRGALPERHAARAVALLTRADGVGYLELPGKLELLRKERDFDALRSRDDFKRLLDVLQRRAKTGA